MTPVEPGCYDGHRRVLFAKDQAETYLPLPASIDPEGAVLTEWEPTAEELQRLLCGGRIRVWVHTFDRHIGEPGHPLQPISLEALEPECGMRES
jgi:hypothetical protein